MAQESTNLSTAKGWVGTLTTALVGGGIVAAVIGALSTWYSSRPSETVASWSMTTAALGTTADVQSLVPGIMLEVDKRSIPTLYRYSIDLVAQASPFREDATIAMMFPTERHVLGFKTNNSI
jgi:hypothetical protein